jgi:hypothetical protein
MVKKAERPGAGGTEADRGNALAGQRRGRDYRSTALKRKVVIDNYYLHVTADGCELRLNQRPFSHHAMHVEVIDVDGMLIEQTTMQSVRLGDIEGWIMPKPHGRGWLLHDDSSDHWTIWRRSHVAESAL